MSRNARNFSFLIFTACIILIALLTLSTGIVYADSNSITNENVYYEEGLDGIEGNEFLSQDLNKVISHDESLIYINDFSNSKLIKVNNKLALIGSKDNKASFILFNSNFEAIISFNQEDENTVALDLINKDDKYILLTTDNDNSYIFTFEQNGDEYVNSKETIDGQYTNISNAQDGYILLNDNQYKLGDEPTILQDSIDAIYFNSNIYYLTYVESLDENELALNILNLNTNAIQSTKIGTTNNANIYVNASGVFVNINGEVIKINEDTKDSLIESTNTLIFKDSVFELSNGVINIYDYTFEDSINVQLKSNLEIQDLVLLNSKIYALINNNIYLISLDNREVIFSDNLSYAAGTDIDYSTLATINGVALSIDSSNVNINEAGEYKVIYSFESNNSTYYFYLPISITTFEGIENNKLYLHPVSLEFGNGYATLNGEEYLSGTIIENVGEYTINVYSNDDYELCSYTFAILDISQLKDNETYADELILYIPEIDNLVVENKDSLNNTKTLTNGESNALTSEGKNTLTITYKESTYTFDYYIFILQNEEELSGGQYASTEAGLLSLNFTDLTTAKVLLNNKDINTGYSDFSYFGTYKLVVLNTNDKIIKNVTFTIDTKVIVGSTTTIFKNGDVDKVTGNSKSTTSAKITFDLLAKDVKLNQNNAYSGMTTYNAGKNTLVLQGLNGYSVSITFTIDPTTNLINNYTYTGSVLPAISGGVLKLNGNAYTNGTLITTAGDYKLEIYSEGVLDTAYKTITFTVLPEILNVSSNDALNPDVFTSGVILAKTNNTMYLKEGTSYISDSEATLYTSNEVISAKNTYVFRLYYVTYKGSVHANNEYGYNEDNNTYYLDYYFEVSVELGINIENNQEFVDSAAILFAGASIAQLKYFGTENVETIENGYILKTIGKYEITIEQGMDSITRTFTIAPRLNVENSRTYLSSENITIIDNGYAFSTNGLNLTLTKESGSVTSSIETITSLSDIVAKKLSQGTYQLNIESELSNYKKVVNFIVVPSTVLSRGATYDNGKSFEFNMYGVQVNLIAPQTGTQTYLENQYVEGSEILTVGKHYVSFIFTINGVTTSTDYVLTNDLVFQSGVTYYEKTALNTYEEASVVVGQSIPKDTYYIVAGTDSAIYFYVRPVIKYSQDGNDLAITKATSFTSNESIYIQIKDGNNVDYPSYKIDSKSQAFETNSIYNEIGKHTLTITLGDISYNVSFTIETYFVEDGNVISESTSETNRLVFEKEATFTTITPVIFTLDAGSTNVDKVEINTIGNHTLTIVGTNGYTKKLYILIKEVVTFNSEKVNSTTDVSTYSYKNLAVALHIYGLAQGIKVNNVNQTISGKEFELNNKNVGYYTILITGANKYTATYLFTILDDLKINGNKPKASYDSAITISCENTQNMKLNIAKTSKDVEIINISTEDTINVVGAYSLVVNGVGSYVNTYTFEIQNELQYLNSNVLEKTTMPSSLVSTSAVDLSFKNSDVIYATSTRNGVSITTFERLDMIGQYDYIFIDANGNEINYGVTIQESLLFNSNKATSYTYTSKDKVTVTNSDNTVSFKTIKLNGVATTLSELTNIATLGNNELVIENKDGNKTYTKTYTIKIQETVTGSAIFTSKDAAKANAFDYINAPSYIFNNSELTYAGLSLDSSLETYNAQLITSYGLHEIVVSGVNNYNATYYLFVNLNTSLIDGKEYLYTSNDLDFTSNAKSVYLDENTSSIDEIGIHHVRFVGQSSEETIYTITTKEGISLASGEYDRAISPKVLGTFEDVDVDVYPSFENGVSEFNTVGTYVLTVYGTNNYTYQYTYILKDTLTYTSANVLGATNLVPGNRVLDQSAITLNHVNSTLKYKKYILNGVEVPSLPEIELIGVNELIVTDINNQSETYEFALGSDVWYTTIGVENKALTVDLDVHSTGEVTVNQVTTNIYYTSYTLNGKTVPVDGLLHVVINTIGNNILVITDINGVNNTYTIVITETSDSQFAIYKNAADAKTNAYNFEDNAYASFGTNLGYSLKMDNKAYTKGDEITSFGLHTIKVLGVNDYVSTYYLYVNLKTNLINEKTYNSEVNISANANISANFSSTYEGGKISQVGNHTITFTSVSSQEEVVYEISIIPLSTGSELYLTTSQAFESAYDDVDNAYASFGADLTYTLKLDGKNYTNAPIATYGYHEIKVVGFNYTSNPYYVFINLNTTIDNTYYEAVLPSSNAKYYVLDDSSNLETPSAIKSVGNHTVTFYGNKVDGTDAPSTSFDFVIKETSIGSNLFQTIALAKHSSNAYDYLDNANASFGTDLTYDIYLDNEDYVIGSPINTYGPHTIKVVGTNGYEKEYYLYVNLYASIENGATYENSVEILSNAKISATYNNAFNGGVLNTIGNHEITFASLSSDESVTYNILIKEAQNATLFDSLAQALDNAYGYLDNVSATFGNEAVYTITLNGNAYTKGSIINKYGMHEIKVHGFNYESNPYYVFINLYTTLENNKTYEYTDSALTTYKTNAQVVLDDNSTSLTQIGKHVVTFVGNSIDEDEYKESIFLTIVEISDGSQLYATKTSAHNNAYDYENAPYVSFGSADIAQILLDGEEYTQNTPIDGFGMHQITLSGVNGYSKTFYLDVNLYINLFGSHEFVYSDPELTNIVTNAKSYYLDATSTSLTEIGIHKIALFGVGGRSANYTITTKESNSVQSGVYTEPIIVKVGGLSDTTICEQDPFDFENNEILDRVGRYNLTIYGVNGYESHYSYVLSNTVSYSMNGSQEKYDLEDGAYVESTKAINLYHSSQNLTYVGSQVMYVNNVGENVITRTNINGEVSTFTFKLSTKILYSDGIEMLEGSTIEVKDSIRVYQGSEDLRFVSYTLNGTTKSLTSSATVDVEKFGLNILTFKDINGNEYTYNIIKAESYEGSTLYLDEESARLNPYSYENAPSVTFNTQARLDGATYSGEAIKDYGLHEIVVTGINGYVSKYYVFVNLYTNIEDNATYLEKIENIFANANIEVDGVALTSDTITKIGYHTIKFTSKVSEDAQNYNVLIKETVSGIVDGETYNDEKILVVNGDPEKLIVNGQDINASSYGMNVVGTYEVKVVGTNGYISSTYTYTQTTDIVFIDKQINKGKLQDYQQSTSFVLICEENRLLRYAYYELNGVEYSSLGDLGTKLYDVGNNILKVRDVNGNETTYNIPIVETSAGRTLYSTETEARDNAYKYKANAYASFTSGFLTYELNYDVTLDGEAYEEGTPITTYGLHEIKVIGINGYESTYYIYVDLYTSIPYKNWINEGSTYSYLCKATFESNAEKVLIDGEESDKTTIYEIGYHDITFISINGDEETYTIFIKEPEALEDIDYETLVNTSTVIEAENCKLLLNGEEYISGTPITRIGNYKLEVIGTNGYHSEYNFKNVHETLIEQDGEYIGSTPIVVENADVYIDYVPYTSEEEYTVVGTHTLTIKGEGGYVSNITFTIVPNIKDSIVLENNRYVAKFELLDAHNNSIAENEYVSMDIDGLAYTANAPYTIVGNHTLSVNGYGYAYTKEFVLDAFVPVVDGETYSTKITLTMLDALMALDDKALTEEKIVSNGTHTLKVVGANGYEKTITFTYKNPNYLMAEIMGIIVVTICVAAGSVLVVIRRVRKNNARK